MPVLAPLFAEAVLVELEFHCAGLQGSVLLRHPLHGRHHFVPLDPELLCHLGLLHRLCLLLPHHRLHGGASHRCLVQVGQLLLEHPLLLGGSGNSLSSSPLCNHKPLPEPQRFLVPLISPPCGAHARDRPTMLPGPPCVASLLRPPGNWELDVLEGGRRPPVERVPQGAVFVLLLQLHVQRDRGAVVKLLAAMGGLLVSRIAPLLGRSGLYPGHRRRVVRGSGSVILASYKLVRMLLQDGKQVALRDLAVYSLRWGRGDRVPHCRFAERQVPALEDASAGGAAWGLADLCVRAATVPH
mmetsp:Transcript_13929/g.39441  ORF Transcript_13929/g.39441 Transcript_13929/m.39441 type:complete len:298 (-) Transcript_13929:2669-3562(-)